MNSNKEFFELLKSETLQSAKADFQKYSISPIIADWTQSQFSLMSKFIETKIDQSKLVEERYKNEIGRTISISTLERIFKHGYLIPAKLDQRRLKTLNKLCLFCNYINWYDFVDQKKQEVNFNINDEYQTILEVVEKAVAAEYRSYQRLPELDSKSLEKYFSTDGPAFKRIFHILQLHISKGWIVSNKWNPSTYQIIESKVTKLDKNIAEVNSKEYWYLRWFDPKINDYPTIYDQLNQQYYLLEKKAGLWKVKINHYPHDDY